MARYVDSQREIERQREGEREAKRRRGRFLRGEVLRTARYANADSNIVHMQRAVKCLQKSLRDSFLTRAAIYIRILCGVSAEKRSTRSPFMDNFG